MDLDGRITLAGRRFRPISLKATTRPSGRAVSTAGPVEHSFRSPYKVQGKGERVLKPLHHLGGELANLTFKTHGKQRSQSLNIGHRFTIEERCEHVGIQPMSFAIEEPAAVHSIRRQISVACQEGESASRVSMLPEKQ